MSDIDFAAAGSSAAAESSAAAQNSEEALSMIEKMRKSRQTALDKDPHHMWRNFEPRERANGEVFIFCNAPDCPNPVLRGTSNATQAMKSHYGSAKCSAAGRQRKRKVSANAKIFLAVILHCT